jgi:hypothetical protein
MFETPGAANITLETLAKIAAGLRVGVIVKFVPFYEMLRWENSFSPDAFDVAPRLEEDEEFINPEAPQAESNLVAASSIAGGNEAASHEERDTTRANNARRQPSREFCSQGAVAGGM